MKIYFEQYWRLLILTLFEPNATKLVQMRYGHVVASIGEKSEEMPYTAFNAKKVILKIL